jgi:ubiquitin-conjugating enzyme E2 J1
MTAPLYNSRSPSVKRLMKEAAELHEPTYNYFAQPLEENLFEWHFTIRGPDDTPFAKGIYHGRISLPAEYPMKPPNIIFLTPNGRFETNKKICLSISGYHPETWRPSWSIRTALLALIGFMPTHGTGAIGSLDYTDPERERLALKSVEFKCDKCGAASKLLNSENSEEEPEVKTEIEKYSKELTVSKPASEKENENNNKQANHEDTEKETGNEAGDNLEEKPEIETETEPPKNSGEVGISNAEGESQPEVIVAEIEPEVNRKSDLASFMLMWFLIFAISFLIYRRLKKHNIDLVELFYETCNLAQFHE